MLFFGKSAFRSDRQYASRRSRGRRYKQIREYLLRKRRKVRDRFSVKAEYASFGRDGIASGDHVHICKTVFISYRSRFRRDRET